MPVHNLTFSDDRENTQSLYYGKPPFNGGSPLVESNLPLKNAMRRRGSMFRTRIRRIHQLINVGSQHANLNAISAGNEILISDRALKGIAHKKITSAHCLAIAGKASKKLSKDISPRANLNGFKIIFEQMSRDNIAHRLRYKEPFIFRYHS